VRDTAEIDKAAVEADASHYLKSSLREKMLEHIFMGELVRCLWSRGVKDVEVLHPETDFSGYDLAIECNGVLRHIQLKACHHKAKTRAVAIQTKLANKPSGCVIWIHFDQQTLALGPFFWFGGRPGEKLPDLGTRLARHTRANSAGVKKERPQLRIVEKRKFRKVSTCAELASLLFGGDQGVNS
jgi:hypothetical protein